MMAQGISIEFLEGKTRWACWVDLVCEPDSCLVTNDVERQTERRYQVHYLLDSPCFAVNKYSVTIGTLYLSSVLLFVFEKITLEI